MQVKINRHLMDFEEEFTIEFNVKSPFIPEGISEECFHNEWESGLFTNSYAHECFEEIQGRVNSSVWSLSSWSFAGRSGGWFALRCDGPESSVTQEELATMKSIVLEYFRDYGSRLKEFYVEC